MLVVLSHSGIIILILIETKTNQRTQKRKYTRVKNPNILWSAVQFVYFNTCAKYNRENA